MRILFASEFMYLPQAFGGAQSSTHELATALAKRGHAAAVAAMLSPSGFVGLQTRVLSRLMPRRKVRDSFLGYSVYRRWKVLDALPELVDEFRPDFAVVQPSCQVPLAREFARLGVPVAVYLRDVEWYQLEGDPRELGNVTFLANSHFTAERFREEFSLPAVVIPPVFKAEDYRTSPSGDNVTFINPHSHKGVDIAAELVARCPDIPFSFVRSWDIPEQEAFLGELKSKNQNLTLAGPTRKMKDIYGRAKILLAPSRWEEAWGRVATEAQFSGIPVLASNRGGLPESVGPGGIQLDPDGPIEDWVEALRRLWFDKAFYADLSAKALAYAERPQINPERQIDLLLETAQTAIRGGHFVLTTTASRNDPHGRQQFSSERIGF
jgi:glycosyltransferase involved in cell wall biosynthesis